MNDTATPTHPGALTDDAASLRQDVAVILLECHRDQRAAGVFHPGVTGESLHALAAVMARLLGPLIGGRYVPKRDDRAARDAEVWQAFTGANHLEVQRRFGISRRLLYSILSRKRRRAA